MTPERPQHLSPHLTSHITFPPRHHESHLGPAPSREPSANHLILLPLSVTSPVAYHGASLATSISLAAASLSLFEPASPVQNLEPSGRPQAGLSTPTSSPTCCWPRKRVVSYNRLALALAFSLTIFFHPFIASGRARNSLFAASSLALIQGAIAIRQRG